MHRLSIFSQNRGGDSSDDDMRREASDIDEFPIYDEDEEHITDFSSDGNTSENEHQRQLDLSSPEDPYVSAER